jgi:copper homeostasis protein
MKIEVCIASAKSAEIASKFNIDRFELNSALELGGLTPDLALFHYIKTFTNIPIMCMVRPRAAGFLYDNSEYEVMLKSIENFVSHGAEGIVLGFLKEDRTIDVEKCKQVRKIVPDHIDLVFHRAFDFTKDLFDSLCILEDCGFTRVLTSGGKPSAVDGAKIIKELVECAKYIEILPGSGMSPVNCKDFIDFTKVDQIHGTFSEMKRDKSTIQSELRLTNFGNYDETLFRETSSEVLQRLLQNLVL